MINTKKLLSLGVCIFSFLLISFYFVLAQEPSPTQKKEAFKKAYPTLKPVKGPDLYPWAWMWCTDCQDVKDELKRMELLPVKEILIYVRNAGDRRSAPAQGKMEFYDRVTGTTTVRTFNVPPIDPGKDAGPLIHFTGFWIIKGVHDREGIKISVTFTDIRGMNKTNTWVAWVCW